MRTPGGFWICNDDSVRRQLLDPLVRIPNPPEGRYDIWVGSYRSGVTVAGELGITSVD